MDPVDALARCGGVAWRATLIAWGCSDTALGDAVRQDRIERVRRGVYALHGTPREKVASVAWNGRLTCVSAASQCGLPVVSRRVDVHLALQEWRSAGGRHAWPPGWVRVHMPQALPQGPTTVAEVVDSCAPCVGPREQLAMLDSALNKGLMGPRDVDAFVVTPLRRRRWLARHADGRAQSLLETFARLTLTQHGLRCAPQARVERVGFVDLLVEDRVIVETDGGRTHATLRAFNEDRRRDREAFAQGLVPLRFTYADVMEDPDGLARTVKATLRSWDAIVRAQTPATQRVSRPLKRRPALRAAR